MKEFIEETSRFLKNRMCFLAFWGCKIQKNKIVVTNYFGKGFGDSSKYIVQELLKRDQQFEIVWLVSDTNKNNELPEGVRGVKFNTIKSIHELATAGIWLDNSRKMNGELKKKGQCYIQIWHGLGPKKCEKDVELNLSKSYVYNAKQDSKMADLFVSSAKFLTDLYKKAFWYDGEILEVGFPRNDVFSYVEKEKIREKVLNKYRIDKRKKILMYAPTFRNSHDVSCYDIDFKTCIKNLEKRFGGEWVVLLRLHPNITELNRNIQFDSECFFDASEYSDAQELLVCADAFISDYSSILIDFFNSKRPSFVYAPDIEAYKKERNFYFDLNILPADICQSNEELMEKIIGFDEKKYLDKLEKFECDLGICKCGSASEKIVDYIIRCIEKEK